jgi:hypothetical protein
LLAVFLDELVKFSAVIGKLIFMVLEALHDASLSGLYAVAELVYVILACLHGFRHDRAHEPALTLRVCSGLGAFFGYFVFMFLETISDASFAGNHSFTEFLYVSFARIVLDAGGPDRF